MLRRNTIPLLFFAGSVAGVRKDGDLSRSLDRFRQFTLMHCAGAGHTAGEDLSSLADKLAQFVDILVINGGRLIGAELANLFSRSSFHKTLRPVGSFRTVGSFGSLVIFHDNYPF